MKLKTFFEENNKLALAFSGGSDSSYLLYAGVQSGADIRPYYIKTAFQPQFELDDARRLADELGVKLIVIELDILLSEDVVKNQLDRCYHCKRLLFNSLAERAQRDGYPLIIDGTNASDDYDDRPGMRALNELKVRSPLRQCGITENMVRERSKEAGIFTWNKPSYSCLATRISHYNKINEENIKKVERLENMMFDMGFIGFRVRIDGSTAKIQIPAEQMGDLIEKREKILFKFKPEFTTTVLDLEARK